MDGATVMRMDELSTRAEGWAQGTAVTSGVTVVTPGPGRVGERGPRGRLCTVSPWYATFGLCDQGSPATSMPAAGMLRCGDVVFTQTLCADWETPAESCTFVVCTCASASTSASAAGHDAGSLSDSEPAVWHPLPIATPVVIVDTASARYDAGLVAGVQLDDVRALHYQVAVPLETIDCAHMIEWVPAARILSCAQWHTLHSPWDPR